MVSKLPNMARTEIRKTRRWGIERKERETHEENISQSLFEKVT